MYSRGLDGPQFMDFALVHFVSVPPGNTELVQFRLEQLRGQASLAGNLTLRAAAIALARSELPRLPFLSDAPIEELPAEPPALDAAGRTMRGDSGTFSDMSSSAVAGSVPPPPPAAVHGVVDGSITVAASIPAGGSLDSHSSSTTTHLAGIDIIV
jgi:hypothetical protein